MTAENKMARAIKVFYAGAFAALAFLSGCVIMTAIAHFGGCLR